MSSLSFVPRNVAKNGNVKAPSERAETSRGLTDSLAPVPPSVAARLPTVTQKTTKCDGIDYADLITLSLSDYALWLDPDLRQKLRIGAQEGTPGDGGYISLNHLFEHSTVLVTLFEDMPKKESHMTRSKIQSAVVRAIRAQASHLLEVRLLLHPDQTVPRFGKTKEVGGGYEVRRKRMGLVVRGKSEWDARTLYLENIPPGYRTYAEIIRFVNALLRDAPSIPSTSALPGDALTRIQGIMFPLHHSDKLASRSLCKGFALVTFAHSPDCEHLIKLWPWFREPTNAGEQAYLKGDNNVAYEEDFGYIRPAREYNFRVIAKERWLELKAEYLTYRQRLVEEINADQDTRRDLRGVRQKELQSSQMPTEPNSRNANTVPSRDLFSSPSISPLSPYPANCLVFIKNVHPETTKTTLRHLFSRAFRSEDVQLNLKDAEGLDYVDFNKGMATCYVRLASPNHTDMLMAFFNRDDRKVVQVSGMDESGSELLPSTTPTLPGEVGPIIVDRVTGRPEEIYWEKVPSKVKKSAVERAISLMGALAEHGGSKRVRDTHGAETSGDETLKKRRK